ncbi:MAG: 2-polyprenylphenol 6-hydroxylase [Rhizobiales bacterium]|nr:2-polyprenylphenol 6-hydroxylase [Hyphomicrobiales bacterium]
MFSAIGHLLHLARVGFVLAREGVFNLVPVDRVPAVARPGLWLARMIARRGNADRAQRLMAALTRLGPSYVKTGQFLSTRPDIVGMSLAQDLSLLQDTMPAFAQVEAERVISTALGKPITDIFASFGPPVAAASIAQVHRAEIIEDGVRRAVAVKVLRPGIARIFQKDIKAQAFAARLIERLVPSSRRLRIVDVIHTLERTVELEMDLRFEAAALSEMAENTAQDLEFSVPKVDWATSARPVLTMDWVDGIKLADLSAIDAAGIDRVDLARITMQNFLQHALRDGFFHADMHQGNLFATREGRLVAVDLGIMGRLGAKERRFLAEILFGFITRNYIRIAEVHFEAGYVPAHHSVEAFAQALRAVGEKIHGRNAAEISMADLLGLLFEITGLFDMATRTELVLLQKTLVVVEGVSRTLDPGFNMWVVAEPVIRDWIERNLGPVGRLEEVGREARALLSIAKTLPDIVTRSEHVLAAAERGIGMPQKSARGPLMLPLTIAAWIIALALIAIAIAPFSP